jgi:hypothetical protein
LAPLEQEPKAEPEPELDVAPAVPDLVAVSLVARHRIDPLALPQGGLFRRRRGQGDGAVVEVQDRPPEARALPGRARRED